jgi:type I restriction enzyme S subunit
MSDWATSPLHEVLEFREGPGIMAADFHSAGVPLIRLAGLKRGANLLAGCNFLDPTKVDQRWRQFRVQAGDVLLSTSASLGEVAVVDKRYEGAVPYTGIIAFRPLDDRIAASFIPHMLTDRSFVEQVQAMGVGSVMKHFGPSHLRKMTVTYPNSVDTQLAIAEVLGALDDKIAANASTLALLDELTQSEFTRARRAVVSAPVSFGDIAAIGGGGTPKTAITDYWDGDVAWATPTDVTGLAAPYLNETKRWLTAEGLDSCSSPLYPAGSILMTSRATIGAFAVAQKPMAVNQGFIVVNSSNPDHQWWLFHEMRARVDEFLTFANGATFLELPRGRFKSLPVQIPDEDMARAFRSTVTPLHDRAVALVVENERLAATRDQLLSLLMSGRITVRGAERTAENVT